MPDFITENLTMVKGDTKSFGFELSDSQEASITLDTAYFSCKKNYEDADYVFQKSLNNGITAAENNQFIVRVAPEDTQLLDPGQYYYDLQIGVNSDIYTIIRGILEIVPEVTEPNAIVYTSVNWGNINGTLSNQSDLQAALNNKANTEALAQVATTGSYEDLSNTPNFATVATSGLYNDLIGKLTMTQILDLVYPIGTYYWSSDPTNPGTVFGVGTWTQIQDKFIYAAGTKTVGDTGGEETHTLTISEIPSHDHKLNDNSNYYIIYWPENNFLSSGSYVGYRTANNLYTSYTGGGGSHNNMPPYLVAYCFRRDA